MKHFMELLKKPLRPPVKYSRQEIEKAASYYLSLSRLEVKQESLDYKYPSYEEEQEVRRLLIKNGYIQK